MSSNKEKKHICVIGAGASGLIVMKELTELGHSVTCFELLPVIGGVYVKSYNNTILTTSSLLTAWSDFSDGKENLPKFWTAEEYLQYMDAFAKHFNLYQHINFLTQVKQCRKNKETGKWDVTVQGKRACEAYMRIGAAIPEDPNEPLRTLSFDALAVCCGTNYWPARPKFRGEERFQGPIIHSEEYKQPDAFAGKRVLIVGAGESGSDIIKDVSEFASHTGIAIRGKHGHLIPRIQSHGRVTDLNTNRARYSNPYILGDTVGYVNQWLKCKFAFFQPKSVQKEVLLKIGELNMQQKTSAFSKFGCKNEGFVTAMVTKGAELHRDNFELFENKAVFNDGTEFECDVILACTGYTNQFPFFKEYHPEISDIACAPRELYKQVIHVDHAGEVAFFGFARPAFGSIPPTVEMQARFFSMIVNKELALPSKQEMRDVAKVDRLEWEKRFAYDSPRVKGLVDFQVYCDGLAKIIGCMPPLYKLMLTRPYVFYKIMLGPFTMHQYRLYGPHARPDRALEIYKKLPVGDLLETSITVSFLVFAKFLSLIPGFGKYRPNEL